MEIHQSYQEIQQHFQPKGRTGNILTSFIDYFSERYAPAPGREEET